MNDVRVDLAEGDELPALSFIAVMVAGARGFESAQERCAVALDCGAGIVFGEAEIEITFGVGPRESPGARGKAVDQPRNLFQLPRAKDKDIEFGSLAGWFGSPGWHTSMLLEAAKEWIKSAGDETQPSRRRDGAAQADRSRRNRRLFAAEVLHRTQWNLP